MRADRRKAGQLLGLFVHVGNTVKSASIALASSVMQTSIDAIA